MMKHHILPGLLIALAALAPLADCRAAGLTKMLGSGGSDLIKAATLSTEEVKELGKATVAAMDAKNKVAPADNAYARRLDKIVAGLRNEAGLSLNYKVYLTNQVNAFACPDGSIRVFSALMDMMDDDELYFVIGHEIGHVADGDSADKLKMAYAASGARKTAGASGGAVGALSSSQLGSLGESLVNARFSQSQESDADVYGLKLMQKHNKNQQAAVSALRKLATPGRASSMFDSHPDAGKRADAIAAKIEKGTSRKK
jgi:putative metalloprotease